MRTILLSVVLASSFVVACTAETTSPSSSPSSSSPPASTGSDSDVLSTDREVGECGTSMSPLTVRPLDESGPTDVASAPKVTAKGGRDSIVFLAERAGVDCSGGEVVAKKGDANFIDIALRFQRVEGEPVTTNCFCANAVDVKGTIKDLPAGHYELRVVREQMKDGKPVEEVITPTSVGVDVGGS